MTDRFAKELQALVDGLCKTDGALDPATRRDLVEGKPSAGALGALAIRVVENAGAITDEQIAKLTAGGASDDQVFETVLCAATSAGLYRLRKGLALLGGKS
jgi:hypothetical protein